MTAEIISLSSTTITQDQNDDDQDTTDQPTRDDKAELRRARIRILQLESSLTAALRDSVMHHRRALDAEGQLRELLEENGSANKSA